MHLTPSAVHRQLRLLGEGLGVELYEQRGKQLLLSAAGLNLLPLVQDLLLQYRSIEAASAAWRNDRRGTIRIGAGPTFASYVLPRMLEAFRDLHPNLDIYLEAGHTEQFRAGLSDGLFDVVFLVARPGFEREFAIEASWDFEIPVVACPRQAPSKRIALKQLADVPFLLYRQGSFFEEQIDRFFRSHGFSPKVAMRLDNAEPIKALVRSGFGMALLPDWVVASELGRGELTRVETRQRSLRSKVVMIRRKTLRAAPMVSALISLARTWRIEAR
jgi:DNA-binding transcriptional LysR family regulator